MSFIVLNSNLNNIRKDRVTIGVYFIMQSGWLLSSYANYYGSGNNGLEIANALIVGDRSLTNNEINLLSGCMNIANTSISFMTTNETLISSLLNKIVSIEFIVK